MNSSIKKDFEAHTKDFNEEQHRRLKTDILEGLIVKLQNDEDSQIEADLEFLVGILADPPHERNAQREFKRTLSSLQRRVNKSYGYAERGSLKGRYIGIGICFGLFLGAALLGPSGTGDPGSGAGYGMVIGIVISIIVGTTEEKKAEKKGLLY